MIDLQPPYDPLFDEQQASPHPLLAAVSARGGVARASTLVRAGHSRHRIAQALANGSLVRVRRDWVAMPGADAYLVAAARDAVVVSCVTAARRGGLWVLDAEAMPHVAASPHAAGHKSEKAVVHWCKPVVPRHPDSLVDSMENVLVIVAACQPYETALAIWESALRHRHVDALVMAKLQLPAAARQLLEAACPFSDSGLETFVVPRLKWMRLRIVPQVWIADHRVDFLIGERLVLQVDGGHHVGAQRTSDIAHDALLMTMGYHVIRVSYHQIVNDWPAVQQLIMRAVAQGLHRAA